MSPSVKVMGLYILLVTYRKCSANTSVHLIAGSYYHAVTNLLHSLILLRY